ncbi:MAG: polysaccharide biosynthesis protein [Roseivirga sp.]|nr:polysaccharide biosynthesis protein [Roseivirga sp.]
MIKHIKTLNILPRWIIVIIDLVTFAIAALVGYMLRLNFDIEALYEYNFLRGVLIFMMAGLIGSLVTRSFAGIIRYTGLQDTLRVLYANLFTLGVVFSINYLSENSVPYSVAVIAFFVSLVALVSYRLLVKELFSYYRTVSQSQKKVLIFGAGRHGITTKQVLENDVSSNVKIIGFLEDNTRKINNVISGIRIYSARQDFEKLAIKHNPQELILAANNIPVNRKNELVDQCLEFGIKISTVPSADQWIGGEFSANQIQEIKIEDLLGRNVIDIQNKYVSKELTGKSILITGAAGSIGSELVRQLIMYNPSRIVLLDQSETGLFEIENEIRALKNVGEKLVCFVADISNKERLKMAFDFYKPSYVFHAAAYKHVPMMEANPWEAVGCNVLGTRNLSDLSVEYEVEKFVMISTDKAVNPTNVMGATKRAAEIYVQSLNNFLRGLETVSTKFVTTRFGNVLGSNGSVIPIFQNQIQNGGPITVTHPDITRYFMTIPEACNLVLDAGVMGDGGEIFVFDMGESVKILDLAKRMIQLSGLQEGVDIDVVFSGLRPGEKLYEELLDDKENTLATHHPKIMISQVREMEFDKVRDLCSELEKSLNDMDDFSVVAVLKKLVSEYKSRESKFQALDVS